MFSGPFRTFSFCLSGVFLLCINIFSLSPFPHTLFIFSVSRWSLYFPLMSTALILTKCLTGIGIGCQVVCVGCGCVFPLGYWLLVFGWMVRRREIWNGWLSFDRISEWNGDWGLTILNASTASRPLCLSDPSARCHFMLTPYDVILGDSSSPTRDFLASIVYKHCDTGESFLAFIELPSEWPVAFQD